MSTTATPGTAIERAARRLYNAELALHDAHGASSRLLLTRGQGHNRILASDEALDAVLAFASGGVRAVDAAFIGDARPARTASEMRP